jgi:hypothetical protein
MPRKGILGLTDLLMHSELIEEQRADLSERRVDIPVIKERYSQMLRVAARF